MNTQMDISSDWSILQDVNDVGEQLRLYEDDRDCTLVGAQVSEWEPIPVLEHLQCLLDEHPYWGRRLRYFNQAPWWYRRIIQLDEPLPGGKCVLKFSNVDYYCKVWLNGHLLGSHEGYSAPFTFDISSLLCQGRNTLMAKVWSPWDTEIRNGDAENRTYQVERRLVKGTYEHDDGLIARDVNPVGIYGKVTLEFHDAAYMAETPRLTTWMDEAGQGRVKIRGTVASSEPAKSGKLRAKACDPADGRVLFDEEWAVEDSFEVEATADDPLPWFTWDMGEPKLYDCRLSLDGEPVLNRQVGFRSIQLERDEGKTRFLLNHQPFYVRGTSYFPDVYISRMNKMRYMRDLQAIKDVGFNMIWVHVHVEMPDLYDLCDQMGIAVIQDSEYNWNQPRTAEWADTFVRIFVETVELLDRHASIFSWICLNEPGVVDDPKGTKGVAMTVSPGPAVYQAITETDPTRPVIKGSYCADDPTSGDSHNYTGSLDTPPTSYTLIDGTTEKLNTEFGFDAPGVFDSLRNLGGLSRRIQGLEAHSDELQHYQTELIKYYIEHYRCQKESPNWGYIHFMFIDLCPQSFYGLLDWWGLPKPAYEEVERINQPVGLFFDRQAERVSGLVAVNDSSRDLGEVAITWCISDSMDQEVSAGSASINLPASSKVRLDQVSLIDDHGSLSARLTMTDARGRELARNVYGDVFGHPEHPKGHPERLSHEFGVRLYSV